MNEDLVGGMLCVNCSEEELLKKLYESNEHCNINLSKSSEISGDFQKEMEKAIKNIRGIKD